MNDYIVLIRRKPSPGSAAACLRDLDEAVRNMETPMVFLHGEGIDAWRDAASGRLDANPGADWCVCLTSLERRSRSGALPPPFRVSTLVTFYQAVLSARRIDSLGLGGSLCCRPASAIGAAGGANRLLLEVGFAPTDRRQRRETLEMVLGAAALELDASVLFHGEGLAHLVGDAAHGWAQITDFDLLGLYAEVPAGRFEPGIDVQALDAPAVAGLRARAATILIL